jgi:CRP-like cAMP-binding protein/tetratricopeptide (TPR) repeat protein
MITGTNAKSRDLILRASPTLKGLCDIINGCAGFSCQKAVDATGRELLKIASQAWLSRSIDLVDQAAQAVLALPLDPRIHNVAQYYRAYASLKADGLEEARLVFEGLADGVPPGYVSRAFMGIAFCLHARGGFEELGKAFLEAARAALPGDPLAKCAALRGLALSRSLNGDHKGSVADLERLFPVMRSLATSYPDDYRYYLNNLAYELGELGRIDEAKAAITVALRSTNAHRFPDWAETARELETKRRRAFYPLMLAIGAPEDEAPGRDAGNSHRSDAVAVSPLVLRSCERVKPVCYPEVQPHCNSGRPGLPEGQRKRWLAEIIEGVARFRSQAAVDLTARQLVNLARQAWMSREIGLVDQTTQGILMLPIDPKIHGVALYYRALSGKLGPATTRFSLPSYWSTEGVRSLLERLADNTVAEYKPRILLALGNSYLASNDLEGAADVYLEAARRGIGTDPLSRCGTLRMLALIRSFKGDHAGSLADLEHLYPLVRCLSTTSAGDYHEHLNNLAYELGNVGRIEEAKAAINVALRSPYASRFPNWAETAQELEAKPRRAFLPLVLAIGAPTRGGDERESRAVICSDAAVGESLDLSPVAQTVSLRYPSPTSSAGPTFSMGADLATAGTGMTDAPLEGAKPAPRRVLQLKAGFHNRDRLGTTPGEGQESLRVNSQHTSHLVRLAALYQKGSARAPPLDETKPIKTAIQSHRSVCSISPWTCWTRGSGYRSICARAEYDGLGVFWSAKAEVCSANSRAPPSLFTIPDVPACGLAAIARSALRGSRARGPPCPKYIQFHQETCVDRVYERLETQAHRRHNDNVVLRRQETAMSNALMISPREENCKLRARNLAAKVGFLTIRDIWPEHLELPSIWNQLPRIFPRMGSAISIDEDEGPRLFILERGWATLYVRRPILEFVRRVEPGTILGEMPIVGISMLGTEAEAGRDCQAVVIDEAAVDELVFKSGDTASRWLRAISTRFAACQRDLLLAQFGDLRSRLASLLLELADPNGVVSGITHAAMGDRLGAHRESITTELSKMKYEGLIRVARKKELVILDIEALRGLLLF